MIVTRGKLTADQAARVATVAECIVCGQTKIFLDHDPHTAIRHECAVGARGARWDITERPSAAARRALAAS